MSKIFERIALNGSNRCEAVETSKAYALKIRNEICFIPKEHCKMFELDYDNQIKWIVEIPIWLIERNEKINEFVNLINQENENRS
jgi:hypothetical protein